MDPVQIQANLDEANSAYHNLITGTLARVVVDQNGERVEFTATNKQQLAAYILQLQGQLQAPAICPVIGPAMFIF